MLDHYYVFTGDDSDVVLLFEILEKLQTSKTSISPHKLTIEIASTLQKWGARKDRERIKGKQERTYHGIKLAPSSNVYYNQHSNQHGEIDNDDN